MADIKGFSKESFEAGLKTRREVLGSEWVDKSLANRTPFTEEFQQLLTQYCWDEIWNRPGLERRQRSMINIAMLTALGKPAELKLHVRGAINNGVTRDEIKEILLQAAIYAGVPAALEGFKAAQEVLSEMDR